MGSWGVLHLITSFMAIAAGGWVLLIRKGTRWHRTLGHVYAMSMVGVCGTALAIYDLTGSFGPFHVAAIVGGLTLFAGMWAVLARRPRKNWITAHATWMAWSYIGLMGALVAETATRFVMPRMAEHFTSQSQAWTAFWVLVVGASAGVFAVGIHLVRTRLPASVAAAPEAMRQEREALKAARSEQPDR